MAATVQTLIKKAIKIYYPASNDNTSFMQKINLIAAHFGTIKAFLNAKQSALEALVFMIDAPNFKLTQNDWEKIHKFQQSGMLDAKLSIQQNFVKILTNEFVSRQINMIESLELKSLNINPILAAALNLNNAEDLIRYYVYQAASRSVVTSVGFLVQNLILYASEYVYEGKEDELGVQTKWDIVVQKANEVKAYLEVKSGTNDINSYFDENYLCDILQSNVLEYDHFIFDRKNLDPYLKVINFVMSGFTYQIEQKILSLNNERISY